MSEPLVVCVLTTNENIFAQSHYGDGFSFIFVKNGVDLLALIQHERVDVFVLMEPFPEPAQTQLKSLPSFFQSILFHFKMFGQNEVTKLNNVRAMQKQKCIVSEEYLTINSKYFNHQFSLPAFMNDLSQKPCIPWHYYFPASLSTDPYLQWFFKHAFGPLVPQLKLILNQHFSMVTYNDTEFITMPCTFFDVLYCASSVDPIIIERQEQPVTPIQQSWIESMVTLDAPLHTVGLAKAICTDDVDAVCRYCENGYSDALIKTRDGTIYSSLAFAMIFDNPEILNRLIQSVTPICFVGQRSTKQHLYLATFRCSTNTQVKKVRKIYDRLFHQQLFESTKLSTCILDLILQFCDNVVHYRCTFIVS